MKLPYVKGAGKTTGVMTDFGALNTNESAGENEFICMTNLSGHAYPYLATRRGRKKERSLASPGALIGYADELIVIDGGKVYRGDAILAEVSHGEKKTALMGALLLIWPDRIEINLKTGEVRRLENRVEISGGIRVSQSSLSGEDSDTGTFIKIAADGIGRGFRAWDGVEIEGLEEEGLNGAHILYAVEENFLIVPGIQAASFEQAGGVVVERKCPDMDFIAVQGNRVWGCSGEKHEIYASKLGDASNWRAFAGTAADSYAATAAAAGDFTGAAAVNDTVVFFQEDGFHKVLGTKPANFQIVHTPANGVMKGCEKSLCLLDGCLYYMGRNGVYAYDGALPVKVSRALDMWKIKDGCAGAAGNLYRLSCRDENGNGHMLVFDVQTGLWHREDDIKAQAFASAGGKMYFAADGALYQADCGEEKFEWECVTGRMALDLPGHKYLSRITVECETDRGAKIAVSVRYDDKGPWEKEMVSYGRRSVTLNLREKRASFARIRLRGTGGCRIYAIARGLQAGSEILPGKRYE